MKLSKKLYIIFNTAPMQLKNPQTPWRLPMSWGMSCQCIPFNYFSIYLTFLNTMFRLQ